MVSQSRTIIGLLALTQSGQGERIGSISKNEMDWKEVEITDFTEYEEFSGVAEDKGRVHYDSSAIVKSNVHSNKDRFAKTCGSNQRLLTLEMTTDTYGYETTIELLENGNVIESAPEEGNVFDDSTDYTFEYCVKVGQEYTLNIHDEYGDGFCCEYGPGTYKLKLDGELLYNSRKKPAFTDVASHTITVPPPVDSQPANPTDAKSAVGEGCITVEILPDNNGDETFWHIVNEAGTKVHTVKAGTYDGVTAPKKTEVCLPRGKYEFVIGDTYGDGICCVSGKGFFKVSLDGAELFRGGFFKKELRYTILVKFDQYSVMNARDIEYLEAHNVRRKKYHEEWGTTYKELRWSAELAKSAEKWANALLSTCGDTGIKHEKNNPDGENLAKNVGSAGYMGKLYPADNILKRWVENELTWGWPKNAHLTQALWRPSRYVGCGESAMPFKGGMCRIQVCRYTRAGNCAMGSFDSERGNNWKKPVLEDVSRCGRDCPPEGCH